MELTKTAIKKFQKDVADYQEYVEGIRILRYLKKKRKFAVRIWKPRWFYIKKFRENYLKKHGYPYISKKQRKKQKENKRKQKNTNAIQASNS